MELLETQDPEKRKLIETSERHKRELEKEVSEISARTEKMLTNALIIGGTLAVTYFIVSRFSGSSSKRKSRVRPVRHVVLENEEDEEEIERTSVVATSFAPTLISQIGTKVINQATLVLLDIARQKLNEYLTAPKAKDENS